MVSVTDRAELVSAIADGMASNWWRLAEGRAHIAVVLSRLDELGLRVVAVDRPPTDTEVVVFAGHVAGYWDAMQEIAGGPWTPDRLADWHCAHDLFKAAMSDLCRAVGAVGVPEDMP